MKTIVTLTLNPSIDKTSITDKLLPEAKLRCSNPTYEAGGGGVNVSRAIKKLGGDSVAIFPSGAHKGDLFEKLLLKEEIDFKSCRIKEPTRENFIVVEKSSNHQYRFTLEGPTVTEEEANQCLDLIKSLPVKPEILVVSGSMPKGLQPEFMRKIAQAGRDMNSKLIVDTSGPALHIAIDEGVYLLKPNLSELGRLTNHDEITADEVEEMAMELINKGKVEVVVVSLGPNGAQLVTKNLVKYIPAPAVPKKSTVGAGDSMVAGMVLSLAQGKSILQMAQYGVACGTAATMNPGTELCKKADADRLFKWIEKRS